uniref:Lysine transporter (LysE) n=1 Tax=Ochrobactrum sp. LM19 TaxID=1449781 RepID=A0A0D5A1D4_9HYPH|nr:LysE family translocator [Ochrobactrum sp. LM19]AJW29991.1 lysine transporter (LysE) [Ochrobactrum sp. LM19]
MTILGISYVALGLYYWTMSVTPGPNNVMLTLSGVNFGFGNTIPHIFGIAIGCAVQTFLLCLGLGFVFHEFPAVQEILKWAGAAYLIYLALKLIGAKVASGVSAPPQPLSLFDAASFQFINPKAWVKATTTATIFMPEGTPILAAGLAIFSVCSAVNIASSSLWAGFGVGIRKLLSNPQMLRIFNLTMAALLIGTAIYVVLS